MYEGSPFTYRKMASVGRFRTFLLFERNDRKVGLVVDSVAEMVMHQSASGDLHFHMPAQMFSVNDDTGLGDQGILAQEACLFVTPKKIRVADGMVRPALQVPLSFVIAEPSWRVKVFGSKAGLRCSRPDDGTWLRCLTQENRRLRFGNRRFWTKQHLP